MLSFSLEDKFLFKNVNEEDNRFKKVNVRKYSPKVISRYSEDTNFRPGFYKQMKSFINRNYKLSPKPKENLNLLKLINDLNKKV